MRIKEKNRVRFTGMKERRAKWSGEHRAVYFTQHQPTILAWHTRRPRIGTRPRRQRLWVDGDVDWLGSRGVHVR